MNTKCLGIALTLAMVVTLLGDVSPAFAAPPVCPGDHPSCKEGGPGDDSQQLMSASCALDPDPAGGTTPGIYSDGEGPYVNLEQGVQCTIDNAKGRHRLATGDQELRMALVRLDVDIDCNVLDNGAPEIEWSFDGEARIATQTDGNLLTTQSPTDIEMWIQISDGNGTGPRQLQYGGQLKGVFCGAAPTVDCVRNPATMQCVEPKAWTIDARDGRPCFRGATGRRAIANQCQAPFFETVILE